MCRDFNWKEWEEMWHIWHQISSIFNNTVGRTCAKRPARLGAADNRLLIYDHVFTQLNLNNCSWPKKFNQLKNIVNLHIKKCTYRSLKSMVSSSSMTREFAHWMYMCLYWWSHHIRNSQRATIALCLDSNSSWNKFSKIKPEPIIDDSDCCSQTPISLPVYILTDRGFITWRWSQHLIFCQFILQWSAHWPKIVG